MKTFNSKSALLLATFIAVTAFAGASQAKADDYRYNNHHSNNGYWDHHRVYHNYEYYHGHRGYWQQQQSSGVRVFINL